MGTAAHKAAGATKSLRCDRLYRTMSSVRYVRRCSRPNGPTKHIIKQCTRTKTSIAKVIKSVHRFWICMWYLHVYISLHCLRCILTAQPLLQTLQWSLRWNCLACFCCLFYIMGEQENHIQTWRIGELHAFKTNMHMFSCRFRYHYSSIAKYNFGPLRILWWLWLGFLCGVVAFGN